MLQWKIFWLTKPIPPLLLCLRHEATLAAALLRFISWFWPSIGITSRQLLVYESPLETFDSFKVARKLKYLERRKMFHDSASRAHSLALQLAMLQTSSSTNLTPGNFESGSNLLGPAFDSFNLNINGGKWATVLSTGIRTQHHHKLDWAARPCVNFLFLF